MLHPLPCPFISFIQVSFHLPPPCSGVFCSPLSARRAEPLCWEGLCTRCGGGSPPRGRKRGIRAAQSPFRASQTPYKTHRVTTELCGMRCMSLSIRQAHPQKMETYNEGCLTRAQNTAFDLWEPPRPQACSGHASTKSSDPEC